MHEGIELVRQKIMDRDGIRLTAKKWIAEGHKLVFTNGCFDLLHFGHLHYLSQARDLGDKLIVGINSAASVQRLKGPGRPINDETTRFFLLAALQFVDAVVPFEEDTPLDLIRAVQPHILVKGGDWKPEQIVGSDLVLEAGGQVLSLPFVEGYSTTNIEQTILSRHSS